MTRAALLCLLLAAGGCGLSHTVDRDHLREIAIVQKLVLFDAHNEVAIAIDEMDEIRREIADQRVALRHIRSMIRDAEGDGDRAQEKGDAKGVEVNALAVEVYELQAQYQEVLIDHTRGRLERQSTLRTVAQAKLELAKAQLVKRNNMRGADEIDVEDFEDQVGAWIERAKEERRDLVEAEAEVEEAKAIWLGRRDELHKLSDGALGNPWVEEASPWESW